MESMSEAMKSLIGQIKQIGSRICDQCGKEVAIMQRGNEQVSECLNCENIKLSIKMIELKKKREADKVRMIFERYSYVPKETKKASLDNFIVSTEVEDYALRVSKRYLEIFDELEKNTLVFAGSVGVGKTHLAYSISKQLQEKGKKVVFITVPELLLSIRDTFKNNDITEYELMQIYKEVDLLVMDDIGAEYLSKKSEGSSWGAEIIYNIVNTRTDSPTIFTTNLDRDGIEKHYGGIIGKRIASRMGKNAIRILLTGTDKRSVEW